MAERKRAEERQKRLDRIYKERSEWAAREMEGELWGMGILPPTQPAAPSQAELRSCPAVHPRCRACSGSLVGAGGEEEAGSSSPVATGRPRSPGTWHPAKSCLGRGPRGSAGGGAGRGSLGVLGRWVDKVDGAGSS